jgi:chromate reductase, NAD(P)H dehydrogenase (quinone)
MQVLALSGSLRAASINTALLHVAARLAPAGMTVQVFGGIADLPLFNIDLEQAVPTSVAALRAAVAGADALLIASPEYAHGVSGVMKNTLDWLVSLESFVCKPVALLNAQPRAQFSDPALREILTTMSADLVLPASLSLKLNADTLTEAGMLASESVCAALSTALAALHSRCSQPTAHVHAVYPLDSASGLAGRQGLEVAGQ